MPKTGFFHSQMYQGLAVVLILLFIGTELDIDSAQSAPAISTPRTTSTSETLEPQPLPHLILPSQIHPVTRTPVNPPAPLTPVPTPTPETTPEPEFSPSPEPESPEENNQTQRQIPTPTPTPSASPSPTPDMTEIEALILQIEFELDNLPA